MSGEISSGGVSYAYPASSNPLAIYKPSAVSSQKLKLDSEKSERDSLVICKGKAREESRLSNRDRQLTTCADDQSALNRYMIRQEWEIVNLPQYKASQVNLEAQANAYVKHGEKLVKFLKGYLGESWERQWFTSAKQIDNAEKLGGLIFQAFVVTQALRECPVEQAEGLYKRWNQLIIEITEFDNSTSLSSQEISQFAKRLTEATPSSILLAFTTAGIGLWNYLLGIGAIIVSGFVSLTVNFCLAMLSLLISFGKDYLRYIDKQNKEGDRIIKEEVLKPLITLFEKHCLSEQEIRQMDYFYPAINKASTNAAVAAEQSKKAAEGIEQVWSAGQQLLDTVKQENEELKTFLQQQLTHHQQNGYVAGNASASGVDGASGEVWTNKSEKDLTEKQETFSESAKALRRELQKIIGDNKIKEIDQILFSLIFQEDKTYREVTNGLEVDETVENFLWKKNTGEEYYQASKKLKECYEQKSRILEKNYSPDTLNKRCLKHAGINPENIPVANQSNLPSSDIVLKTG